MSPCDRKGSLWGPHEVILSRELHLLLWRILFFQVLEKQAGIFSTWIFLLLKKKSRKVEMIINRYPRISHTKWTDVIQIHLLLTLFLKSKILYIFWSLWSPSSQSSSPTAIAMASFQPTNQNLHLYVHNKEIYFVGWKTYHVNGIRLY